MVLDGVRHRERLERYAKIGGKSCENISYSWDDALDVIVRFIIDDGKPNRGHRDNIFQPKIGYIGVGYASHPEYTNCIVIDYAQSVTPLGN